MKAVSILCLALSLTAGIASLGQAQGSFAWKQTYNGKKNQNDLSQCVATDSKGNVYLAGNSNEGDSGWDMTLLKYDSKGKLLWKRQYNGPDNKDDYPYALAVDQSDNVIMAGGSVGVKTSMDFLTVKYDANGVRQWTQRADGDSHLDEQVLAMTVDGSGNIYVTGLTTDNTTKVDYLTIKYNKSGVTQWRRTYNGPASGRDVATGIAVDANGNVYITGYSYQGQGPETDYVTIKYSAGGTQQWVRNYNGSGNNIDKATAIGVDKQGNVYVTGTSDGANGVGSDYATLKYNTDGKLQWSKRYNGSANLNEFANAMVVDGDGNVYVTGASATANAKEDIVTIKYTTTGAVAWKQTYDGVYHETDLGYAIAVDASGNVWVVGQTGKTASPDAVVLEYNSSGQRILSKTYNGAGNGVDYAHKVAIDSAGNAYIAGITTGTASMLDFWLLAFSK